VPNPGNHVSNVHLSLQLGIFKLPSHICKKFKVQWEVTFAMNELLHTKLYNGHSKINTKKQQDK
jgi:hypothetical protein